MLLPGEARTVPCFLKNKRRIRPKYANYVKNSLQFVKNKLLLSILEVVNLI